MLCIFCCYYPIFWNFCYHSLLFYILFVTTIITKRHERDSFANDVVVDSNPVAVT